MKKMNNSKNTEALYKRLKQRSYGNDVANAWVVRDKKIVDGVLHVVIRRKVIQFAEREYVFQINK